MNEAQPEFQAFPKMARLVRDCVITEKIDGTNAQVMITESGDLFAGSRTRWITPTDDNFGFAKWCEGNKQELLKLGPGRHFGEWWGHGINRAYGIKDRRFSLFNVIRWCEFGQTPQQISKENPHIVKMQDVLPELCRLVPVLYRGPFATVTTHDCIVELQLRGSVASPGFMNPEGIVVFHIAGNVGFKRTIENDDKPKSALNLSPNASF